MEDKKHMCNGDNCGNCQGWCDHHFAGPGRHDLARMLLSICILLFIFWLGLAVGELKAYLREGRLDGGGYYGYPMMGINPYGYTTNHMMRGSDAYDSSSSSIASPSPSPMKKGY